MHLRFASLGGLAVLLLAACASERPATDGAPPPDSLARQAARDSAAGATLARYLDMSRVTGTSSEASFDSVFACAPPGRVLPVQSLARFRVLSVRTRGDSADASAEVVTVAEQAVSPNRPGRYVARQRIRIDTLHWTLGRPAPTSRWKVCGIAREGVDFGRYGGDADTDWETAGASWEAVRALADSIHAAP